MKKMSWCSGAPKTMGNMMNPLSWRTLGSLWEDVMLWFPVSVSWNWSRMQMCVLKCCCQEENYVRLVIPGIKRRAHVNISDGSEPLEKCQVIDEDALPLTLPGTSQDGNILLPALPGTSQDGDVLPPAIPVSSQPDTTVQQSSEELQYALLGHTWGAGTMLILVCAQRGMRAFTFSA